MGRRPEIDAQLLLGRSLTLVAAEFQVSRSTLGRMAISNAKS